MSDLVNLIRTKYPDSYKDMSDDDLEKAVLDKYPQYKDLATKPKESSDAATVDETKPEKISGTEAPKTEEAARPSSKAAEPSSVIDKAKDIWHKATSPLVHLTPELQSAMEGFSQEHPVLGTIGKTATEATLGLSSPLNLATAGVGGLEFGALKAGLPKIAAAAAMGTRALSVPTAVEGGVNLLHPDSTIPERIAGGVELAGGIFGMAHGLGGESPEVGAERPPDFKTTNEPLTIQQAQESLAAEKPRYRLDPETGMGIPISQTGEQIGPAVGPKGEQLRPDLAADSKYAPKSGIEDKSGKLQKMYDLSRGLMSVDLPFTTSAAFRQSSPMVGTKAWFQAWKDAATSYGSTEAFKANQAAIESRELFKPNPVTNQSFAEVAGLKLGDLGKYSRREEAIRGELAEKIPVYGKHVAGSNRAYTSFLNNVRADTFENLINAAKSNGPVTTAQAREIAEFVNTATGVGKLGVEVGSHEISMERGAKLLSNTFFSPRKMASEIRMMNPSTYIMASPQVRAEYLKAMARRVGVWWTMAGLAELGGAQVSKDPNSADFGKIRIGNTRIDPPGGMQQFLVLGHRMLPKELGGQTNQAKSTTGIPVIDPAITAARNYATTGGGGTVSSTSNKFNPFGVGFKPNTEISTAADFMAQRLHPVARYIYDYGTRTKKEPFHVMDRTAQMFLPMFAEDLANVIQEDPGILPAIGTGLSSLGMGVQSYDKHSIGKPAFIPERFDLNIGR